MSQQVETLLKRAYKDDFGAHGHETLGHKADASAGHLMYGELLPGGVSKALHRLGAKSLASDAGATLLELGSGTGKVALQAFLECPGVSRVVGVEISRGRHETALAAVSRLSEQPGFSVSHAADGSVVLRDAVGRSLELQLGDLTATPASLVRDAAFVLLQVVLPEQVATSTQRLLLSASEGCVAMLLQDLTRSWAIAEACPFQPLQGADGDRFATSWSPVAGHRLHVYRVDRSVPATITQETAWRLTQDDRTEGHEL